MNTNVIKEEEDEYQSRRERDDDDLINDMHFKRPQGNRDECEDQGKVS